MLWILVIYIASATFCITTLKNAIQEGIEDGEIDNIHANIMYSISNVLSFIPVINTLLSVVMLYIYAEYLIPCVCDHARYYIWRIKRRIRNLRR